MISPRKEYVFRANILSLIIIYVKNRMELMANNFFELFYYSDN